MNQVFAIADSHVTNTVTPNTISLQNFLQHAGYVELPLYRASRQDSLMVMVSFEDQSKHLFIVDTGAAHSAIDEKIINHYGAQNSGKKLSTVGAGGSLVWTHFVLIPTMNIATQYVVHNQSAILMNAIPQEDDEPISGILGLDFLRQNQAILDIDNQKIYLKPIDKGINNAQNNTLHNGLIDAGYKLIHLEKTPNSHQTVLVQINHVSPVSFLLDTGAPISMVGAEYAKTLALQPEGATIDGSGSTGGEIKIIPTKIQNISIAGLAWNTPIFYITTGIQDIRVGTQIYGIIGMEWMREHNVILDIANDLLFVKPTTKEKIYQSTILIPLKLKNNFALKYSNPATK